MWLYIPDNKHTSRSTPVEVDSILDSDARIQMLSRSYTWNESYRQPRSWLTTLKRVYWMKHLFGLIPEPSTADRLLEKWIGSLEDFHASHSQSPETERELTIHAGSGNTLGDWLLKYDPDTSSWRTPQVSLFEMELEQFSASFLRAGTMRNGFVYEHRMSVRPIEESESSSWLTPHGMGGKDHTGKQGGSGGGEFAYQANNWGTPNTMDSLPPKSQEALDRESSTVRKGRSAPNNLRDQVNVREGQAEWPTATTDSATDRSKRYAQGGHPLSMVASEWPTPSTQEYPHPGMVINEKGRREPKEGKTDHSLNLEDRASTWATPRSNEWKGTGSPGSASYKHRLDRHYLDAQSESFHQHPTTVKPGQKSSENDQTSHRRLNPKFVEWLMDLPERWIELHYFGS